MGWSGRCDNCTERKRRFTKLPTGVEITQMTKLLLTNVAALFLAAGIAHANEDWLALCGKHRIHVWGHHGFEFYLMPKGASLPNANDEGPLVPQKRLSRRLFWFDNNDNLYFRGRKCKREDHNECADCLDKDPDGTCTRVNPSGCPK